MKTRTRTLLASSLILGVLAGPASAPGHAATGRAAAATVRGDNTVDDTTVGDADSHALAAAIAGLPGRTPRPHSSGSEARRAHGGAAPACTISPPADPPTPTPASGRAP